MDIKVNPRSRIVTGADYSFERGGHITKTGPQLIETFDLDGLSTRVGAGSLAAIVALQFNIVALNDGLHATFPGGAGRITYEAATPLVAARKAPEGAAARGIFTAETSNVTYSVLNRGASQSIVQHFGTPLRTATSPGGTGGAGPQCVAPTTWDNVKQQCTVQGTKVYDQAPPQQNPR